MNAVEWIEKTAINPLNDKPVVLLDWQKEVLANMYNDDASVKIPNLFVGFVKKIGKSALIAMVLAYLMQHRRKELYVIIASSEEQAHVIYRSFIEIFKYSQFFSEVKVIRNRIIHKFSECELRVLTSTPSGKHGLRPTVCVFDECMASDEKTYSAFKILQESMSLSLNPQVFLLSNVPSSPDHFVLELYKRAKKDKDYQVVEFKAPENFRWDNPKAWEIANPFYKAGYPQVIANYQKTLKEAKIDKKSEVAFKRYKLGWGTLLDDHTWIDNTNLQWVGKEEEREKILKDESIEWSVGFDLSLQGMDATSWVLAGWLPIQDDESPLNDQKLFLYGKIYYGNIEKKQSLIKENIISWHREGHLTYQNSEVINQNQVLSDFREFMDGYPHIKEDVRIIFDPALSHSWREALQDEFVTRIRTYSPKEMTAPIRNMQRLAETKSIYMLQEKNPAIMWQAQCGFVSELSKNWCMLNRHSRNPQLNLDFWSASLLALSELLKPRSRGEAMVI